MNTIFMFRTGLISAKAGMAGIVRDRLVDRIAHRRPVRQQHGIDFCSEQIDAETHVTGFVDFVLIKMKEAYRIASVCLISLGVFCWDADVHGLLAKNV